MATINIPKVTKTGIDKLGRTYTRKVNVEQIPNKNQKTAKPSVKDATKSNKSDKTKQEKPKEWWQDKFSHLKLSRYPVGVKEEDVDIRVDLNNEEECNSKCVMSWYDKKTDNTIRVYTKEFLDRNAQHKWERMKSVNSKIIDTIKKKSVNALKDPNASPKLKQAAAIIDIIANTGLRIGQTAGLERTGNRGVSTLSPGNISFTDKGKTVKFNFVGKSYKENNAQISGDSELFKYLKSLKENSGDEDRLFDVDRSFVDSVFKNVFGFKGLKLKDMRTYVATALARDVLFNDISEFKDKLTGDNSSDKKLIKDKLKECYDIVSTKLNNTPKMAETAYIHPAVRMEFLKELGHDESITKSIGMDSLLNSGVYNTVQSALKSNIDPNDEELCDEYNLFDWEKEEPEEELIIKSEDDQFNEIYIQEVSSYKDGLMSRYNPDVENNDCCDVVKNMISSITTENTVPELFEIFVNIKDSLKEEANPVIAIKSSNEVQHMKLNNLLSFLLKNNDKDQGLGLTFDFFDENISDIVKIKTVDDMVELSDELIIEKSLSKFKEIYGKDYILNK